MDTQFKYLQQIATAASQQKQWIQETSSSHCWSQWVVLPLVVSDISVHVAMTTMTRIVPQERKNASSLSDKNISLDSPEQASAVVLTMHSSAANTPLKNLSSSLKNLSSSLKASPASLRTSPAPLRTSPAPLRTSPAPLRTSLAPLKESQAKHVGESLKASPASSWVLQLPPPQMSRSSVRARLEARLPGRGSSPRRR